MQVKINSYITTSDLTEEQAIEQAISMVDAYDVINENRIGEVVTKLYYIVPILGKILVVVNDADRDILGVESNILANTDISDYPLERLPASVIDYKELIVKVGSSLTMEQIFNAGQSVVEETAEKSMPYKIPVLKVINYNNTDVDSLVMPSIFGSNIFSSIGGIVNDGDAEAGKNTINNASGFTFTSISDIQNDDEWIAIFENKRNSDEAVAVNMDTLRAMSYGVVCVDSSTDEYLFISAEDFNRSLTFDNFDNLNGSAKIDDGEIAMSFGNHRGGGHYGWAMTDTRLNSITNSEKASLSTDSETNTVLLSMYVK